MDDPQKSTTSTWRFISRETFVEHYARMALKKGWIDYAREQVKKMENDETKLWQGLGKDVAKRIKEIKDVDNRN